MSISLPLVIICLAIIAILILFPLIISYKAEKKEKSSEWDKIKNFGKKINNKVNKNK
jgi:DMSO/TMAO reductase YedYZ heme-binding membrane subunit|tara:strand:- start:109 stop:279 length:171 start_codon:yes stop_codon:yes gene_type:complete